MTEVVYLQGKGGQGVLANGRSSKRQERVLPWSHHHVSASTSVLDSSLQNCETVNFAFKPPSFGYHVTAVLGD